MKATVCMVHKCTICGYYLEPRDALAELRLQHNRLETGLTLALGHIKESECTMCPCDNGAGADGVIHDACCSLGQYLAATRKLLAEVRGG